MPSKRQYDLVEEDSRVPLHTDEAFQHGISYNAKYIGTLDVPRPTSRVEIVAAMRRIRYEFKAKGIKKKKVTVEVSVDGVRINLRKKKKKNQWLDESKLLIMHHPIYRIFYVSHDSQDLKIFSFIARDGASNVFKCNVFKAAKKSQAMKIVRTVGQAFEVCHKLSSNSPNALDDETDPLRDAEASSEKDSDAFSEPRKGDGMSDVPNDSDLNLNLDSPTVARPRHLHLDMIPPPPMPHKPSSAPAGLGETITSPLLEPLKDVSDLPSAGSALSAHHEIQLLREQLEQQVQQTQAAVAQVHLLRDQLTAETTARIEAQARTHQLLVHNKELLDHITALVSHLQDNERPKHDSNVTSIPQVYGEPMAYSDVSDGDMYLGMDNNRQSGAYVTAPSSPKSRHSTFFPQPQPLHATPSLYTLYPTPEQQFQAQLLQRLQGLSGYPPMLSPTVYPPPVPYTWGTFPTPYLPKRKDDELRRTEIRLEPPPGRRKDRDVRMENRLEVGTEVRGVDRGCRSDNRLEVGPELRGVVDRGGRRDESRDRRENSKDRRDNSRERAETARDRRDDPRDRKFEARKDDERWERQESREQRDRRDDIRDMRENSRERSSRDVREGSRDRRDCSRDGRERKENYRDPRDDAKDSRDRWAGSKERRDDSRDWRGDARDHSLGREQSRDRRGASPKVTAPLNLPKARSPASPVSPSPIHSPKSSYSNAFASALSTIKTLRVGDKSKKMPGTSTPGPITRSTSEKVQNRSELMDLVQRTAWARQTK